MGIVERKGEKWLASGIRGGEGGEAVESACAEPKGMMR